MRYVRLIASVAGAAAFLALCAPGAALAGTYSWSQPGDFSTTPGANPAQKYGQPSWGYDAGIPPVLTPLTNNPSLPGWSDVTNDSVTSNGTDLVMHASALGAVTVSWNDPLGSGQPVTVTYSQSGTCAVFNVTDQNGGSVASGGRVTGSLYLSAAGGAPSGCTEQVQIQLQASTPAVTLTSPSSGAVFTNGDPQFAGTASVAFDASRTVSVAVYAGGSAAGTPVETLTATPGSGGSYSAIPSARLPNGTYTAVAEQDDPVGQPNFSAPATFSLNNTAPGLTLASLGSKPLLTATPTLSGTAGTRPGDSSQVMLLIYPGASASGASVRQITGALGSGGSFSIRVTPGLADGRYTAVAAQPAGAALGFSLPVTFRVKVHPPALTLTYPQRRAAVPRSGLAFLGQAGSELGDSPRVKVELWRGAHARGKALGKATARVHGSGWSLVWHRNLPNGRYTVRAVQSDDAGHTTRSPGRTFNLVVGPPTIRSAVSLDPSDTATVRVSCLPRGQGPCRGSVLVVSTQSFRTSPGGPTGPLRMMFTFVTIPAGHTAVVSGAVPDAVARVLRNTSGATVRVFVALRHATGVPSNASAQRTLNLSP